VIGPHEIRKRGHGRYLIFYRVLEKEVEILRIVHGARDWAALFADDA
jgi:toxin ParE1/3/4